MSYLRPLSSIRIHTPSFFSFDVPCARGAGVLPLPTCLRPDFIRRRILGGFVDFATGVGLGGSALGAGSEGLVGAAPSSDFFFDRRLARRLCSVEDPPAIGTIANAAGSSGRKISRSPSATNSNEVVSMGRISTSAESQRPSSEPSACSVSVESVMLSTTTSTSVSSGLRMAPGTTNSGRLGSCSEDEDLPLHRAKALLLHYPVRLLARAKSTVDRFGFQISTPSNTDSSNAEKVSFVYMHLTMS